MKEWMPAAGQHVGKEIIHRDGGTDEGKKALVKEKRKPPSISRHMRSCMYSATAGPNWSYEVDWRTNTTLSEGTGLLTGDAGRVVKPCPRATT